MSITDELRAWAKEHLSRSSILAIADRIDAEHESICYDYQREHDDWVYIRDTCWVELPKDADGEYIHVGDVLTDDAEFRSEGKVVRLMLEGEDWFVGFDRGAGWAELSIHEWHHYYAPTVEDVLREFANEVYADADNEIRDRDFLCAKYAKRLTLAEGEDA